MNMKEQFKAKVTFGLIANTKDGKVVTLPNYVVQVKEDFDADALMAKVLSDINGVLREQNLTMDDIASATGSVGLDIRVGDAVVVNGSVDISIDGEKLKALKGNVEVEQIHQDEVLYRTPLPSIEEMVAYSQRGNDDLPAFLRH